MAELANALFFSELKTLSHAQGWGFESRRCLNCIANYNCKNIFCDALRMRRQEQPMRMRSSRKHLLQIARNLNFPWGGPLSKPGQVSSSIFTSVNGSDFEEHLGYTRRLQRRWGSRNPYPILPQAMDWLIGWQQVKMRTSSGQSIQCQYKCQFVI